MRLATRLLRGMQLYGCNLDLEVYQMSIATSHMACRPSAISNVQCSTLTRLANQRKQMSNKP